MAQLFVYPVKSCAGVALQEAELTETGLDLDRAWMVVDATGRFVTQRELPRMALVVPQIRRYEVVLRAPGMLALHLGVNEVVSPTRAKVWADTVDAWDMGDVAAQWFSDFLGRPGLRLVRFDPEAVRLAAKKWTGDIDAPHARLPVWHGSGSVFRRPGSRSRPGSDGCWWSCASADATSRAFPGDADR